MFQEILQAIIGIVNLLNISDKLTSLSDRGKKNKLGKQLRKLYESISRSIEYSQAIEDELKRIVSLKTDGFENKQEALCKIILPRLGDLLTKQKYELLEFQKIIWISDEESNHISLLIEIYGDDIELEFDQAIAWKYSFIHWVDYYLIKKLNTDNIIIPKTFKLSDIPVFKRSYETAGVFYYMDYELAQNPTVEQEYMTKIDFKEINDEKTIINIIEQCSHLLDEILEFNSTQKLVETKSKLANIIRSNFKIEEII
jgi:hypothetical protein